MHPAEQQKTHRLKSSVQSVILAYRTSRKRIGSLFSKQAFRKFTEQLYNPNQSDELKAFSAAFGIFVGIIPVWGFQTLIAISLAVVLRLNKALVIVFSQISFPPLLPVVLWLSYKAGNYWIAGPAEISGKAISLSSINQHFEQYLYGSLTLAAVAAIMTWLLTFFSLKGIKIFKQYRLTAALRKTL